MKYAFCYTIEKVINENGVPQGEPRDNGNYISFSHGLWRDTVEEVERDRILYNKDRAAFLKMVSGTGN